MKADVMLFSCVLYIKPLTQILCCLATYIVYKIMNADLMLFSCVLYINVMLFSCALYLYHVFLYLIGG
jgi:hypothetical protein